VARGAGITQALAESCVSKLAQFFPQAAPVRIPVQVVAPRPGGRSISEGAVIEFGTPLEALFTSTLPLEFDDRIRLLEPNGDVVAEAAVVAVQYHEGRKAVAVRFLSSPLFGQSPSMLSMMLGTGSPGSGLTPIFQSGGARSVQVSLRFRF